MDSIISIIAIVFLAFFAVFGLFQGLKNGWKKQLVRLATVFIALFVSIVLTKIIAGALISEVTNADPESLKNLLLQVGLKDSDIAMLMPNGQFVSSISYIVAIPVALIVAPILFLIFYGIFHLITIIPYKIFTKSVFGKAKKSGLDRVIGMAVGAIYGIVVAIIICSPVTGFTSMVFDTYNEITSETANADEEKSGFAADLDEMLKDFDLPENDPMINLLSGIGGEAIYNSVATLEINGKTYDMSKEVVSPVIKLVASTSKLGDIQIDNISEEDKTAISAVLAVFDESAFINDLFADTLLVVSNAYKSGNLSDTMTFEGPVGIILDALFEVVENISEDSEHLSQNLNTLLESYYVLTDNGVIVAIEANPESAVDQLMKKTGNGNETIMSAVVRKLNTNEKTVPLVSALSKVSISVLSSAIGSENAEIVEQTFNEIKGVVSEINTYNKDDEDYVEKVSGLISNAVDAHDLDIDEEIVTMMAEHLQENHDEYFTGTDTDGDGMISDQEMNNIILSYYDTFASQLGEDFNPDDFNPDDFNPDDFNPDDFNPDDFNPDDFNPDDFNPDDFLG